MQVQCSCLGTKLIFFPPGVLQACLICGFVSSNISSVPLFLLLLLLPLHMLRFLQFPHNSWIFCSVFYIIFLFSLGGSCWHIFKITVSFLSHAQYTDEPIKGILHFCYSNFFVSNISFWIFLRVSISLFILPTHSYMLSTFYIRTLSIRGNWGINCS